MEIEGVKPCATLYVNNLNDKIKQDRLRQSLYTAFTPHGKVIEIVSSKARKLRGQAWIVYESVNEATAAMRQMQGIEFFEKPMRLSFAKSKSDATAKIDGTYKPREKRKRDEPAAVATISKTAASVNTGAPVPSLAPIAPPPPQQQQHVPHNILFVEDLPDNCNDEMLSMLFRQYRGFKEVRMVGKKGLAFVEFADEIQAGIALQGLLGFKLTPTYMLKVSFAKK